MTDVDPGGDVDGDGIPNAIDGFDDGPAGSSILAVDGVRGAPERGEMAVPASAVTQPAPEPPPPPAPPPHDADAAALQKYQVEMERYNQMMQTYSNVLRMLEDTNRAIIDNIRS